MIIVHGQTKQNYVWKFGSTGAGIDFANCNTTVLTNGINNGFPFEGQSSISDKITGRLLFYTDGYNIYDSTNNVMQNGNVVGLSISFTQTIIIKKPGSNSLFYMFTPDLQGGLLSNFHYPNAFGVNYAIVDMTLNGGLGSVISIFNSLKDTSNCEKLTAIYHSNGQDVWLIGHEYRNNNFFSFLITSSGINTTPVISSVGHIVYTWQKGTPGVSNFDAIGELKASPNGNKLAFTTFYNGTTCVADFDKSTGVVSNPIPLKIESGGYGVSFSHDNSKLYISGVDTSNFTSSNKNGKIYQFDISSNNQMTIQNSRTTIYTDPNGLFRSLKLGVDGKIYVARGNETDPIGTYYLGVINSPNISGFGCNYVHNGLYLNGLKGRWGLNNAIEDSTFTCNYGCLDTNTNSFFPKPTVGFKQNTLMQCLSGNDFMLTDTSNISTGTITRIWNFGDATSSTDSSVNKFFTKAGIYQIKLVVNSNQNCADSVTKTFTVYPQTNIGFTTNDNIQCLQNIFLFTDQSTVSSGTFSRHWQLGDATTSTLPIITKTYNAGTYLVKLNTITNHGCIDSTQQTVVVNPYPKPNVGYTQNDFNECFSGNNFLLNDTSSISTGTISRQWIFGDGTTSTNKNLNKAYAKAGTYSIKLFETSDHNCTDSAIKTFTVYPKPSASFTINDSIQCLNENNFLFTDNTDLLGGTYNRYWNLGDSTTNTIASFNKSYSAIGTYQIQLKIVEQGNCRDSVKHSIIVKQNPVKPQIQLVPNIFIQASIKDNRFTWFLDNDSIPNAYDGQTLYIHKNGTYYLKVDSINGCSNSSDPININLFSGAQVLVYPNPNDGNFTIDFVDISGLKKVKIYDMLGKFITSYSTYDDMIEVNSNHILASGMYLIKVETSGGNFVVKVIIFY